MGQKRVYQLEAIRRAGSIPLLIVLAFAEMGFNTIDEGLLRTRNHEVNLIKVRVVESGRNVVAPRSLSQT